MASAASSGASASELASPPATWPSNLTVVGSVGLAAGEKLRQITCVHASCADAVAACLRLDRCDTVEMLIQKREGKGAKRKAPSAVLRASWQTFGTHDASLRGLVAKCRALSRTARSGKFLPGQWMELTRKLKFGQISCDEFAVSAGRPLPSLGLPAAPAAPPSAANCPIGAPRFVVATYQNGPNPWLCTFLRTLGYRRAPSVVVLGWQPRAFARAYNVYYFTDRVYTTLRYLNRCGGAMAADARFMFCDADEMLQLGIDELEQRVEALHESTGARVIISAEARCMPQSLGKAAWEHSERACLAGAAGPAAPAPPLSAAVRSRSELCLHKKLPRCLNTGNFVGRVRDVAQMLNQTCRPCRLQGLDIEQVHRRYATAYTAQVSDWIYSEQAELMRLYLERPPNETGWVLDYGQRLFHPNFWFRIGSDVRWLPRQKRLRNLWSRTEPAFVHYNGNTKAAWDTDPHLGPSAMSAALRAEYAQRTGDASRAALDAWLRTHVSFLGPQFERDHDVTFADVCAAGEI